VKVFTRSRVRKTLRYFGYCLSIVVALLAASIVASVTIDLGPEIRQRAETAGSAYIERPLHIGGLHIRLLNGKVVVTDLQIDGLHKGDRPFFTAKRIDLGLDWIPAFARKPDITISSVEMTDWQMLVERWDGAHNFPRFNHDDGKPSRPRPVTVTLRWLRAYRGQFSFEDHETPWGVVCRNLDVNIQNLPNYHGTATFSDGTVSIQDFVPMSAKMKAEFVIDGSHIRLGRIDLDTDGASTLARGDVDLAHWPTQTYTVQSRVKFPRMRRLFFKDAQWDLSGDGDFTGIFRLIKRGDETDRDLTGTFKSELAGLNDYRFPALYGSLRWTRESFEVWNAGSRFLGGEAQFTYNIKPFGAPTPPTHRFGTTLTNVDVAKLSDFEQLRGLRFAGAASLTNVLEWPSGDFSQHRGEGRLVVAPPPGVTPMTASLADAGDARAEWGPFTTLALPAHLPVAAELTYRYGPDEVTVEQGRFATERTYVSFDGATQWGDASRLPFHVTSRDWQESDQLLAGIITDFGSPKRPVLFGGRGQFDGTMTGAFRSPRIEGTFSGQGMRAFDTLWGDGSARIVVEDSYVNVTDGIVRHGDSEIRADGRFALGYPRDDGGEEINTRMRLTRRDIDSLRHALGVDDYPVSGLMSGEFHLTGRYERPIGFGAMSIDDGVAYKEPFQKMSASVRFDGAGVRLDNLSLAKDTGTITGAAFVGWDSTYSFNADGRRIPVERLAFLTTASAPLTGVAEFTASGSGTFDQPRNDVRFRVDSFAVADESVGQVTGTLALRGKDLSGEVNAASPRLAITGTGRIALTPKADAEITFRFHDSSLDPYVRVFEPSLSEFTTAVASGSIRVVGELSDFNGLTVDGTVDALDVRLLDYAVKNTGPLHVALDKRQVLLGSEAAPLKFEGDGTRLEVFGSVDLDHDRVKVSATGDANLGILQGLYPGNVRASGRAQLTASIDGQLRRPQFSGNATIVNGRLRHLSLPNALDAINGTIQFDEGGIRLDDVSATMGGGQVRFGGRIGFDGYVPTDLNITARGEDMRLRYPEGIRSVVDMDLAVSGTVKAPTLSGLVTVKNALWSRRIDTPGNIFDIAASRAAAASGGGPSEVPPIVPLKLDVQILVPSTLRVENNLARMVANADLTLRGTYEHPVISGHADIERGEVTFEGLRYRITRGSIGFTNPTKIEPFFDVEAETNVRVPGQTYHVTVGFAGTSEQMRPTITSDPWLPTADVLALLFSDVRRGTQDTAPELRALQNPNQAQADILTARATQAIAGPLSSEVGRVVEQTLGVDNFQVTPSFVDPNQLNQQTARLNPTARVTIGKRISERIYLTFSRSVNTSVNDQLILIEYNESERMAWVLSRNEDSQTYALEFRVRHVF
jgi:hypothetical protein